MPTLLVTINGREIEVETPDRVSDNTASITMHSRKRQCRWIRKRQGDTVHYTILVDNQPVVASVRVKEDEYRVTVNGREFPLKLADRRLWELKKLARGSDRVATKEIIKSPMSGQIVRIYANVGDILLPNAPVVALEAMKMEMDLWTKTGGRLVEIKVSVGEKVDGDVVLAVIDSQAEIRDQESEIRNQRSVVRDRG